MVREAIRGDVSFFIVRINGCYSKYLSLYILSMEVISLKSFLKLFHVKNEKPCTVKQLMTNAHVQIGTKRRKLKIP
jgi:hypothetical protein